MKKLFLTLICLFAVCASFAQTDNVAAEQHLKFKGIPIDGTPSEFGAKLKASGFSYDSIDGSGTRWYKGNFAGYNNCEIAVKSNNNLVYEIVVIFPESYSWSQLYNTYSSLKDMLTTKYGAPSFSIDKFKNIPSYVNIEDDNEKFSQVKEGNCNYGAIFRTIKDGSGTIILEIKRSCCIGLYYSDNINERKKNTSAMNDL